MPDSIEAFVDVARRYCAWVESERHDLLTGRQLLLELMQGIPDLVDERVGLGADVEYPSRGHDGWVVDHKRLADFPFQYYREVFSPIELDDDAPVVGDVHDDLADIYSELWHGLKALDAGDGEYAAWHWAESYFQHWGSHAAGALCAIDAYYREHR